MIKPLPCPFCGVTLEQGSLNRDGEVVYWSHEVANPNLLSHENCFLGGRSIGSSFMERWNRREGSEQVHYVVENSLPKFNTHGEGVPATAAFLNQSFNWVILHAKSLP